jgi:cyclopropane fatty-acyl-phospholipid synthase-like methyltransferase
LKTPEQGTLDWKYDHMYENALKEPHALFSDYERINLDAFEEGYFTCRLRKYPWSNANDVLLEIAGVEDGFHLLDAGCGTGLTAIHFCKQYPRLTISCMVNTKNLYQKTYENIQKANLEDRIRVYYMDFDHLAEPILSQRFDRIFMIQSVGYSVARKKLFQHLRPLLKPKGKLVIATLTITTTDESHMKDVIFDWKYNFSILDNIIEDLKGYNVNYISLEPKWLIWLFFNPSDLTSLYTFNRLNLSTELRMQFYLTPSVTNQIIIASV